MTDLLETLAHLPWPADKDELVAHLRGRPVARELLWVVEAMPGNKSASN